MTLTEKWIFFPSYLPFGCCVVDFHHYSMRKNIRYNFIKIDKSRKSKLTNQQKSSFVALYLKYRYSDQKNSFRYGIWKPRPFQRATTRLYLTSFTFKVIFRSWRTMTLMMSWPWNLVYFIWLSKGYLIFRLRFDTPGRCSERNYLGKKLLCDLDLELWPRLKNESSFLHIYLSPIHHLHFGLSEQKGKVSKVSEKSLHNFRKIGKKMWFLHDNVRLGTPI